MNTSTLKNYSTIVFTCLAGLMVTGFLLIQGCSKDNPVPNPAPGIPPKSSMVMDYSDFQDQDTTSAKSAMTYQHWGRAAAHVTVWNTVLTVTLAVPVASFAEAFNHEGVYNPDLEAWVWSYNFMAGGSIHQASLQASMVDEGIEWKMYISKNNGYSDFLWYSGVSNTQNTSGYWTLMAHPDDPGEFLKIEWTRDPGNDTGEIRYTNIVDGAEGYGSYIYYGTDPGPDDAFYEIYGAADDFTVNIEWSRGDKSGRISDPVYFGTEEWQCWDTELKDMICE